MSRSFKQFFRPLEITLQRLVQTDGYGSLRRLSATRLLDGPDGASRLIGWLLGAVVLIAQTSFGFADESTERKAKLTVEIDVLIQPQPAYRVRSQEWGRAFQSIGYFPRFREPKPGEELRVEDLLRGNSRVVHVVGGMSQNGAVQIGNRKYTLADINELKPVLDELAEFGAGGPPEKSARWGFTEEGLQEISIMLSAPLSAAVELQSPLATVESMKLPTTFRLNFTSAARERALGKRPPSAPESIDLTGVSSGTGLAIVLSQYGLGFRPKKSDTGQMILEIDAGNESSNLWPVGWKTQQSVSEVLPAYLKSIDVKVEDYPVSGLLEVVAERLEVPIHQSTFELAAVGRDLDELTYSRSSRMPPGKLMMALGDKFQLGIDVRADEAGQLFLWVTTDSDFKAFRTRFAHVKQN